MKQYEYHGYIIKQVKRETGFGLQWAIYKNIVEKEEII